MTTTTPVPGTARRPVHRLDYAPPPFAATSVDLVVELFADHARVTATTRWARRGPPGAGLRLDGRGLVTESILLDGEELEISAHQVDDETLVLRPAGEQATLQVVTRLDPAANTTLEGLYRSGSAYCTQMEAEGFRRVTWFTDRPDVLPTWTTTVVADRATCPVLLSNGNLTDSGGAPDGRHFASFHDPHPKPCYLFALVAGDLAAVEGSFTTRSGRGVALKVWVEHGEEARATHALASLQRAMAWDERAFGREYDLDVFHLVAVSDFNMGAMENKGLNVFNSQLVLAAPETATDDDYQRIEGVVAHEYLHNWSGNRVTCRDWFQLSLKEGFTVFRDQEFSADHGSRAVQRISDVRMLRELQFAEDGGPNAHPVRPDSYLAIDNFYTTTVYEKGAEVVRMLATLAGAEGFRRGTDLYFERHDGQAATTDDFVSAIADATQLDLSRFRRWYDQAGTPRLRARGEWDAVTGTYLLTLEQSCPPTPGQPRKLPLHIPVRMALLDSDGGELPLRLHDDPHGAPAPTCRVLSLTEASTRFSFWGLEERPVPSLLRGFSAPVRLEDDLCEADLFHLVRHDGDGFVRWDAAQRLLADAILARARRGAEGGAWQELPAALLEDADSDPAFVAQALDLPSELELGQSLAPLDPGALHAAREDVARTLAARHRARLLACYDALAASTGAGLDPGSAARRALKNACLALLMRLEDGPIVARCQAQFAAAAGMTDELAALQELAHLQGPPRDEALAAFRARWVHDPLVMNKWFAVQALSRRPQVVDDVAGLTQDPAWSEANPNKVRALFRSFARNPAGFHAGDGRGYRLLGDLILRLDGRNPVLAGRMASLLGDPRRLAPDCARLLAAELQRLTATAGLSPNTREMLDRALAR